MVDKEDEVFEGVFGSHLYQLNTENSDRDYKGIYMPTAKDIVLGIAKRNITKTTGSRVGKNTAEDVDSEVFSLQEFIKLACEGQTVAIDMLHTPEELTITYGKQWLFLMQNRTKFYSKNMNAFMGYVKKQAAKYGIKGSKLQILEDILSICDSTEFRDTRVFKYDKLKDISSILPNTEHTRWEDNYDTGQQFYIVNGSLNQDNISLKEFRSRIQKQYDNYGERAKLAKDNKGVDWKAVSHALRAGYQLKSILEDGDFEYPLKETHFILDVKQGKLDYLTEVAPELESLVAYLEELTEKSSLPDQVDKVFWEEWLFEQYLNKVKGE